MLNVLVELLFSHENMQVVCQTKLNKFNEKVEQTAQQRRYKCDLDKVII